MSQTPQGATPRRRETRDEMVARIAQEQEGLHPAPVYTARSKQRLLHLMYAIVPISFALGALAGWLFDWSPVAWISGAVGLILGFAYIGYVVVTERDDGRIARETMRMMREREAGAGDASEVRPPEDPTAR